MQIPRQENPDNICRGFLLEACSIFSPIETAYMPGGESGISLPFVGWRKEGERVLFRIDYVVYSILIRQSVSIEPYIKQNFTNMLVDEANGVFLQFFDKKPKKKLPKGV